MDDQDQQPEGTTMKARLAKLTVLAGALSALVSGHTAALGLTGRGKTCGS